MKTIIRTTAALAAIICACVAPIAQAAWPERPVTVVVPFPPGGPTDLVARVLAKQLADQTGQTFVVENKGGANGNIGMQYVAAAKPDGYTVLYNTSSIALSPNLYRNLPFDPVKDFEAVSSTAIIPLVLLAHPSLPVKNVSEFVSYAKAHPGKLSYGSAGAGNVTHLGALLFLRSVGIDAVHVPYRGSAPAMTDLVGGQVQFMTNTLNDSLGFVRDGKLNALAVSSKARSPQLPDTPTLAETVVPDFEMGAWQGMVVPAGTPTDIVNALNTQIRKALQSPALLKQLQAQGAQPLGSTPSEYSDYIRAEINRWKDVVKAANVRLD
ncbi:MULTISPECIES: Bug family tripartite tricarboxylate transporter substrate binding protein [Achromobacter]|jgi:tripartite-type tricarboxylate transporter receptor subunit TctC|uniref:LacI family transcriptional regulator n=1 Tax=Achromobacter spanius TaxID=217203 RepID=A0AAW3I9T6_9BURK|nr:MULTISPECIES: tripartite tricarboxylate transporter substrate binding protein [Achromobacter]AZS79619.1 tripartite tricarboxylate transporter substrate binding protein [Achromobacter spanius]KNE29594.1 LacI family transcriptional regulator [Achromobacter spanius]MCD0499808.1 tripartite tricarboxylate transporter substrate binding protein [Achromobacter sp. MY14]MCW3152880.1 tripartite tricarboxylate transporter substrate binding protein [Achromobacter spanius]